MKNRRYTKRADEAARTAKLSPVELVYDTIEIMFDMSEILRGFRLSDTVALISAARRASARAQIAEKVRGAYASLKDYELTYVRLQLLKRVGEKREGEEQRFEALFTILDNLRTLFDKNKQG